MKILLIQLFCDKRSEMGIFMKEEMAAKQHILLEQRNISKYAGLLCARVFLLCLLLPLILFSGSDYAYFFVFLLIVPWILANILENKTKKTPILLYSCAQKFFYTNARFTTEQQIGRCIILFLTFLQLILHPASQTDLLSFAPGILLLLYLLCRILCTIFVRHRIHKYYFDLVGLNG